MKPGVSRRRLHHRAWSLALCLVALAAAQSSPGAEPSARSARSGGAATVDTRNEHAFARPLPGLTPEQLRQFTFGNRVFNTTWVTAPGSVKAFDGLGPLFNRNACSGCHTRDGRGRPPEPGARMESMLVRLSLPGRGEHGGPLPHPDYGLQLSEQALHGLAPEGHASVAYTEEPGRYPDGAAYSLRRPRYALESPGYGPFPEELLLSPRVAPPIHGLGLLEAVPEATLLALADPEDGDGDGISGRVNRVWDVERGGQAIGRFGWKANQPSLRQQDAEAALGDIGLTSVVFREENVTPAQGAAAERPTGADEQGVELAAEHLDRLVFYTRTLAVPAARDLDQPEVRRGEEVFEAARCSACHLPRLETGPDAPVPQLAGQVIHAYTDLLLHDMGPGLADGRPDFEAGGSEWRTPPLWGIGLTETVNRHTCFLHDGRARSLEEAVLWHGGEAEAAREAFKALLREDRAALLRFLESL